MSIRCLIGRSPSLKPCLKRELKQALSREGGPLLVLVPEQYTLDSEREIIEALDLKGSFRLQVMSPARLYSRVFDVTGRPKEVRVDDRGRVMLMHAALKGLTRELRWYRGAQHRTGFAELAARQVQELKQAGYTPEKLDTLADELGARPLKMKLEDLSLLWRAYEEALAGRFMDGEDEVARVLERLDRAAFLKNSRIWVYGFELISPTLAVTLTALAGKHEVSLLMALEADKAAPDYEAFEPVRRTLDRLLNMAEQNGIDRGFVYLPETEPDHEPDDLLHLKRMINSFPVRAFPGETPHIRLASRQNPLDEAMLAMATIRQRVMSGKMRWRDAAIACADLPSYAGALQRAAELYGVPVFIESSRGADRNALAQFVLTALRLVSGGWQTEDVLLNMRTGYGGLTDDEADKLSNCALEQGLRGNLWKRPLHRYKDERDEALEPLRLKLTEPLTAFEEDFKAADSTKAQMTALWTLLERVGAAERLRAFQERCAEKGLLEAANENAQVWNRLLGTMDQLCALMADVRLTARDVGELLAQSLAASEIKPLPQSGDAVMIGSLSHMRGSGVHLLIVPGCNEQKAASSGGLFQTNERAILGGEKDVWLAPDSGDRMKLSAIDLSAALEMSKRFVVFTYAQSDAAGAALRPGAVVERLHALFPALKDSGGLDTTATDRLLLNAPDAAFIRLSSRLDGRDESARGALAAMNRLDALKEPLKGLRRAAETRAFSQDIDRVTARRLYNGPRSVSITRLEQYAACPFKHFVEYGLRPEKLEPYELQKKDEGQFYHEALEDFVKNTGDSLSGLSAEEAVERMDAVSERLLGEMMDGPLSDNPVMLAYSRRMRMIARRAARTVTKHLADSGFRPCALEVRFNDLSPAIVLHTQSGRVPLNGRIDRIDAWKKDDETWLRVIDYKSGQSTLNLAKMYYGLQLQLIVYLAVALNRQDAHPAGTFYFKVADPLVASESRDPEVVEEERTKELRLSGLYIDDMAVLDAMSPDIDKVVELNLKNGKVQRASTSMMNEEGFELLIRHALKAATQIADGILAGKTAIDPKKMSQFCSCDRCDWRALCQQDPLLGGMPKQILPAIKPHEVLAAIREDLAEEQDG